MQPRVDLPNRGRRIRRRWDLHPAGPTMIPTGLFAPAMKLSVTLVASVAREMVVPPIPRVLPKFDQYW